MAVILPIRRKTQNNQSINQTINQSFPSFHRRDGVVVKSSPRMREIGVRSSVGTDLSS